MMCFSKLFFQLHTLAVDLEPKSESEEPPREDRGHYGGLTLSQILGLDLPQSMSSCQPLFHPPPESDQPQHQDLPSSSRPTHPLIPPMRTPSHQEGLSALGFFSHEGFIAVNSKGQPDKTPGISSQSNQYLDIDQKPPLGFKVNRFDEENPSLMPMPVPSSQPIPQSNQSQRGFQPDENYQKLGVTELSKFDINRHSFLHPELMALPPGPSSAPSTSSDLNSCQPYMTPGFDASDRGLVADEQMHLPVPSPSANLQSRDVKRLVPPPHPFLLPLQGCSSAASPPATPFNAWQHYNTNLPHTPSYQNPAHILADDSLISQGDIAQPSLNCYQQASHNYLMDGATDLPPQRLGSSFVMGSKATATNLRPSVIQTSRKSVKSSMDDLKALAPTTINVSHGTDIESQMTMRFLQEKFDSKKVPEQEGERSSVIVNSPKTSSSHPPHPALLDFEGIGCEERDALPYLILVTSYACVKKILVQKTHVEHKMFLSSHLLL